MGQEKGSNRVRGAGAVALLAGAAALLGGCMGIKPKSFAGPQCAFKYSTLSTFTPINIEQLEAQQDDAVALKAVAPGQPTSLREEIRAALAAGAGLLGDGEGGKTEGVPLLFLSGGSLHGAFGAGYLAQWKRNREHLPRYQVVTGISTGAILGSFAFADMPEVAEEAYAVRTEATLLDRLIGFKKGKPTGWGYVQMVRKGAIGDLAPLRSYLAAKLDATVPGREGTVLTRVAEGAKLGRKFYVGVVDVDTGQARALDMADMAMRWADESDPAQKAHLKGCYVEAIIASSSAPMAALPVFIDNRMYVDGGIRFGAFADELGDVLPPLPGKKEPEGKQNGAQKTDPGIPADPNDKPPPATFHVVMNGYQKTDSRCGRKDPALCLRKSGKRKEDVDEGEDDPLSTAEHRDWEFLDLALRSNGIAVNQVYRFSAERIYLRARDAGIAMTYAQMGEEALKHHWNGDADFPGETTCGEAKEQDKSDADPVQFFPRYMHCIIDYGRKRGGKDFPPRG